MYTRSGKFVDPVKLFGLDSLPNYIHTLKLDLDNPLDEKTNDLRLHPKFMQTTEHGNILKYHLAPHGEKFPEFWELLTSPASMSLCLLEKGVGNFNPHAGPDSIWEEKDLSKANYMVNLDGFPFDPSIIDPNDPKRRSAYFVKDVEWFRNFRTWCGKQAFRNPLFVGKECRRAVEKQMDRYKRDMPKGLNDEEKQAYLEERLALEENEFLSNGTGVLTRSFWKEDRQDFYKDADGNPLKKVLEEGVPESEQVYEVPYTEAIKAKQHILYNPNGLKTDDSKKGYIASKKRKDPVMSLIVKDKAIKDPPPIYVWVKDTKTKQMVLVKEVDPNFRLNPNYAVVSLLLHLAISVDPMKPPSTNKRTNRPYIQKNWTTDVVLKGIVFYANARIQRPVFADGPKAAVEAPAGLLTDDDPIDLPTREEWDKTKALVLQEEAAKRVKYSVNEIPDEALMAIQAP